MRKLPVSICLAVLASAWQLAIAASQDSTLQPFSTDGCSMWIDGTVTQPHLWRHCCVAHDKAYWIGGTEQQRKDADTALMSCVSDLAGKGMGNYMHFFVGIGGSPYWVTPYRWGYGWFYLDQGRPRGYRDPTDSEKLQIQILMPLAEKTIEEDASSHPSMKRVNIAVNKSTDTSPGSPTSNGLTEAPTPANNN